jgi:hypothetical protein
LTPPAGAGRRFGRLTAFRAGTLAGLATFGAACTALYLLPSRPDSDPRFNVVVVSSGADVSRQGGQRLTVENNDAGILISAMCNGGCDDFGYGLRTNEDEDIAYRVQVLDAAGACIVCEPYRYVQPVYGGPLSVRWTITGSAKLEGRPRYFSYGPNGILEPLEKPEPSPTEATKPKAVSKL